MAVWSVVLKSRLEGPERLDAEYYQPLYLQISSSLEQKRYLELSDIAWISDGDHAIMPETFDSGRRYLRAKDLKNFCIDNSDPVYVSENYFKTLLRSHVKSHDILLSIMGTIGNIAIFPEDLDNVTANRAIAIIRVNSSSGFDPYFIAAFLESNIGIALRERESQGGIQQRINLEGLKRLKIPYIVPDAQVKVREKILAAFSQYKKSESLYAEAEALLLHELGLDTLDLSTKKTYVSNFSETVEGDRIDSEYFQPKYKNIVHHLSNNYVTKTLSELGQVTKGRSTEYSDIGVPVIRSGDLTDLDNLGELKYADSGQVLFYLEKGDICISSIGFGSIGKVQIFDKDGMFATVSEVTVVRQNQVNPYYLQIFLKSLAGQLQIEKYITGATGQLHLYPRDVSKICIPIIDESKQKEFEKLVMKARQVKQEAKDLLEQAKLRVEEMILG